MTSPPKISRSPFPVAVALLALAGLLLTGCLAGPSHTYENIRAERLAAETAAPAPSPASQPAPPHLAGPLTLDQALILALTQNPDQDAALARIRQSEALLDQSLAAFLPQISLYGEYTRADAPSVFLFKTIDQRNFQSNTDFNQPGRIQNFETGVKVGWSLFRGGRDLLARHMAATGVAMSREDRHILDNALVASTIKAHFDCLAAADLTTIAQESVDTVSRQLQIMEVRYRAGGVLRSDVLSLEVRLAQAKEALVRADNARRLCLAAMANLLGGDVDADFTPQPAELPGLAVPDAYPAGVTLALAQRPELLKVRQGVVRARLGMDQARAEYLPTVGAQASYYWDAPDLGFDAEKANWMAGLLVNWDIFTGLSTVNRQAETRAMLDEMLAADRKATLGVQLDVKSMYLILRGAQARLEVTRASVRQAAESLDLVKKEYEGGSANITRYLEAELALNQARQSASAARYDAQKARADVARALGLWAAHAQQAREAHEN
ncbi:MAG: TolC family protein [Deltaproteobacteria bacterium]|nr:TolC family protein [Deltaproteobacteria bacterium]